MDNDKYIGRLLDNRYEILEVIGTGGMAVVYKARCHRLNRLVAIKILKDDLSQDEEFRRRFHAESQAVAMLSHPNICRFYESLRNKGSLFIVLEYVNGGTINERLGEVACYSHLFSFGSLCCECLFVLLFVETPRVGADSCVWFSTGPQLCPPPPVLRPEPLISGVCKEVLLGLAFLHENRVIHRDIKGDNILMALGEGEKEKGEIGKVRLADFGVAKQIGATQKKHSVMGTPYWMAPEVIQMDGVQETPCDLWSVGCTVLGLWMFVCARVDPYFFCVCVCLRIVCLCVCCVCVCV